jgi:hypothetical protein
MDQAKCEGSLIAMACLTTMIVLFAACSRDDTSLKSPELACQTMACICVAPDPPMLETPEKALVLWAENGDAYCPEGFELRSATPKDNEFLKKYGG